jgi:hypothetical protein
MNFICKLNHKKIALFINNYNKIISNNNDITYNDRENKVDKKKWPKDSLFIYSTSNDSVIKIAKLKQFSIAQKGSVLAYTLEGNELEKATDKKKSKKKKRSFLAKKKKVRQRKIFTKLFLMHIYYT